MQELKMVFRLISTGYAFRLAIEIAIVLTVYQFNLYRTAEYRVPQSVLAFH